MEDGEAGEGILAPPPLERSSAMRLPAPWTHGSRVPCPSQGAGSLSPPAHSQPHLQPGCSWGRCEHSGWRGGGALTPTTGSPFPRHRAPEGPNPPFRPSPPASPFRGSGNWVFILQAKADPILTGKKEPGFAEEPLVWAANLSSPTEESP